MIIMIIYYLLFSTCFNLNFGLILVLIFFIKIFLAIMM